MLSAFHLVLNLLFPHNNQFLQSENTIRFNYLCLKLNLSSYVLNFPLIMRYWKLVSLFQRNDRIYCNCALLDDVYNFWVCALSVNSFACYCSHCVHAGV